MSRSALSRKIEMALTGKVVARLVLEQCELLIGSDQGAILQPLQLQVRTFQPIVPQVETISAPEKYQGVAQEILTGLAAKQSIEVLGGRDPELLRSLAHQFEMPHGVVYLDQADGIEDLLQVIFEQLYRVPVDVKASRAEIRDGLRDRQVLILLTHPTLGASELEQLCQILPESLFVVTSVKRRFLQAGRIIELPEQDNLGVSQDQDLSELINRGAIVAERGLILKTLQTYVKQKRWAEVLTAVRSIEGGFAIAKVWGAWERVLRWGLQAAWQLEDEGAEAWALHQLGTLAFCQEEVTSGYDSLKEALDLRESLVDETAIAVSEFNLVQLKTLIVPVQTGNLPQINQRYRFLDY